MGGEPAYDPRVDAHIAGAAPFARPILTHLRALVHASVPGLAETMKWSRPHFMLGEKRLAAFVAFSEHIAFIIYGEGRQGTGEEAGKIRSLADLPADAEIARSLRAAADAITTPKPKSARPAVARTPRPELPVPEDFAEALRANAAAAATLTGFSPSHRREYVEWISEAKRPETRARRIAEALAMLAEGKPRYARYR